MIEKYEEDKLKLSIVEMIRSAALDVYSTILHGPSGLGMIKLVDDWYDLKKFEDEADAEKVKSVFAEYLESTEDEDKKAELLNEQENAINEVMEKMTVRRLREASRQKGYDIIKKSLEENKAFNLESLDYSDKIITSAETDVMVLTVASELIKILINGNQCIFLDSDINESHNKMVEM